MNRLGGGLLAAGSVGGTATLTLGPGAFLAAALPVEAPDGPGSHGRRARLATQSRATEGTEGEVTGAAEIDQEAFSRLYRQLATPLASYARRTLGSAEEANDAVQECFFRYLRAGLPAGTDPATARPYLFRSVSHLLRDRWRRSARDRRWRETHAEPKAATPPDRDLASDLDRALGRLKPRDRALLWLAHVEGASHREIARALGLGEASVRVLLFRARKRIEKILIDCDFPTEAWQ